jgi:branched-chain amino acid transport system substrate-binding protein
MARGLLARRLALTGCACATLAVAGCTTSSASSGVSVSGTTLAIYQSVPPGTLSPEAQDVLSAEQLAFNQAGGRVGGFTLRLVRFAGREVSANARQAIGDAKTVAYLGEVAPGTSADSLGITNAEDVLQVSPTDTAVELTRSTPAISGTPDRYYESLSTYGRTFARVVPTDQSEAKAVVSEMRARGIGALYIANDGSDYGLALASALDQDARAASIKVTDGSPDARSFLASGADAIFYAAGADSASAAASLFGTIANTSSAKLFVPSALAQSTFAASLSPAAQRNLYASAPGFTPGSLPPQAQQFVASFRATYGHAPSPQAIFGYAAMAAVIHALQRAGASASNRSAVVHAFFNIRNLSSVLGAFSIDRNGDTSIAPFVLERFKAGTLVPTVQLQG